MSRKTCVPKLKGGNYMLCDHTPQDDMFLLVADCVTDEAWARAMDSGIPLNNSIAKLWATGAGFFAESD